MSKKTTTMNKEQDDILIAWQVDEYPRHERGTAWYALTVIIGIALLIYSFVTLNYLFGLILIMFAVVLTLSSAHQPEKISVAITKDGVQVGGRFMLWNEFVGFWIVYEPGDVKNLYLDFKGVIKPHLALPLGGEDPNEVRRTLKRYLDEDLARDAEPLFDYLGRVLKL